MKMALVKCKEDDMKIEVIGILANVELGEKWVEFLNPTFIEFLHNNMTSGKI